MPNPSKASVNASEAPWFCLTIDSICSIGRSSLRRVSSAVPVRTQKGKRKNASEKEEDEEEEDAEEDDAEEKKRRLQRH